ncbi:transcription elongation factor SPT4 [Meleagris gallopavo]|uniref:transcription elongation factor SPT4 n=1 Tax=Meleagris gallopavo TaxID=9103 RepID=UPI000549D705|nr:transcription elongation factor SPT4 [Meleagris gallopavo]
MVSVVPWFCGRSGLSGSPWVSVGLDGLSGLQWSRGSVVSVGLSDLMVVWFPAQTLEQFEYDGCDNCDAYLQMKGNREMVYDCTSSSFDGIIAMMSPEDSWVSKWQRISNFKPGVYAVSVTGRLPQGIVRELKSRGVAYKSRDTAIKT